MTTHSGWASDAHADAPADPRSLGRIVSDLSEQTTRLVKAEVALAKAELVAKGKQIGLGAGLLVGAAVLGLYTLSALIATAIIGLANAVPAWLAALIVSVALLAVTAVLALLGVRHLKKGTPPVPERAIDNVQQDVATVRKGFQG